jgi:hypothetical protein
MFNKKHMKSIYTLCILVLLGSSLAAKERTYIGSTPADRTIREFLGIPLTDSIDFIRWKLALSVTGYTLECQYGISKPNTNGFIDEKRVAITGTSKKDGIHYHLLNNGKNLHIIEINASIVHFADDKDRLLTGNGGFSYALNSVNGKPTDLFNFPSKETPLKNAMVYEGRTPCNILSDAVGMGRASNCYKLKWHFTFYIDPATGKPSYYVKKGNTAKGAWEIVKGKDGRTIYKVNPTPEDTYTLYFVKAGDNILFFTDPAGNLLIGTEDFSFTLNRK